MQGDICFVDVLEKMGVIICWGDDYIFCMCGELNVIDMDMNYIFDVVMIIVMVVLFVKGIIMLCNIYNWCVKEIDCLFVMVIELCKVGVEVEEGYDYICIILLEKLNFVEIVIYNDYWMVMCFLLVVLLDILVMIFDFKCMVKIFSDYFEQLVWISQVV